MNSPRRRTIQVRHPHFVAPGPNHGPVQSRVFSALWESACKGGSSRRSFPRTDHLPHDRRPSQARNPADWMFAHKTQAGRIPC